MPEQIFSMQNPLALVLIVRKCIKPQRRKWGRFHVWSAQGKATQQFELLGSEFFFFLVELDRVISATQSVVLWCLFVVFCCS
jgi:hypothetical protein